VKVRITETPRELELDGVRLDGLIQGMVRDVSSLMGAWLITEGYAELEMRQTRPDRRAITDVRRRRRHPSRRRHTERRASPD
jgi:hypothetical protein